MIALAVMGILTSIAVFSVQRTRGRIDVERSMTKLQGLVGEAQALAAIAGPRTGTPRLTSGPTCTAGTNQVTVRVLSPTTVEVPRALTPIAAGLQIGCEVFDIAAETDGNANLAWPPAGTDVTFSPAGRLIYLPPAVAPAAPDPTVLFQFINAVSGPPVGFRVLSSGVLCRSSARIGPAGITHCDEDV